MVHAFSFEGRNFLYDVNSGSLHVCDEAAFFVAQKRGGKDVLPPAGVTAAALARAQTDVESLAAEGMLFSPEISADFDSKPGDLKALCLHISHNCNLTCGYCFADGGSYRGCAADMPFDVAKRAVDMLMQRSGGRKNLEIDFFGGEPLLNLETVKRTVDYAKERALREDKQFKFTLTTNGLLLSDSTIDYLCAEMENVVLSIDGRQEVHDRVRRTRAGGGSFDLILDKFLRFKQARGDKSYYVRGTFTSQNLDFCEDVLFLNDLGFDQISVEPVVLPYGHELAIKEHHLPQIAREYEKLARIYLERRKTEKWFSFFHFVIDLENGPCLKKRLTGCGAGGEYLAVTPSGEIYPCHQFAEDSGFLTGNVHDGALDEGVRGTFCASSLLTKPDCQNCFAKYHCSGGCAANSIHYAGGINRAHTVTCEMMKKRTELALAIYAIEKFNV